MFWRPNRRGVRRSSLDLNVVAAVVCLALAASACTGSEETTTTTILATTEVAPPVDAETTTTGAVTTTTGAVTTTTKGGASETTNVTPPVATTQPAEPTEVAGPALENLVFGLILVGPHDDAGWSQAHYEGGLLLERFGARMIALDSVNEVDRPEVKAEQVAADMIAQGAQLIFFTSEDLGDSAFLAARQHPEVPMIWAEGDSAWPDGKGYQDDLVNLGNVMGRMEFGKMIAGCSAALTTETGSIGYLGPLINDETRRLVNSAYLGARYCWEEFRAGDAEDLSFEVRWIGFWFNIPGVTLDPTQVTDEFLADGADVVISGIDTVEALVRAGQIRDSGGRVWAVPYDFWAACDVAPVACLGVPYFNWGAMYLEIAEEVINNEYAARWRWVGPDWDDINNETTSAIGWLNGDALSPEAAADLATFIAGLGGGDVNLWTGPLAFQDGSTFLRSGQEASDVEVWYTERLLAGIEGAANG